MSDNADIKEMSFEQALGELEKIVSGLEGGNVELDKSIAQYERGEGNDGKPSGTEPLDPE